MLLGAYLDVVAASGDEAVGVVRVPGARPQLRQLACRLGARHLCTGTYRVNRSSAGFTASCDRVTYGVSNTEQHSAQAHQGWHKSSFRHACVYGRSMPALRRF